MSDQQTNKDLEPVQESKDKEIDTNESKEIEERSKDIDEEGSKEIEEQEAVRSLVNESACTPFEEALEAQEIVSLPVNNTKHMPVKFEEPIVERKSSLKEHKQRKQSNPEGIKKVRQNSQEQV